MAAPADAQSCGVRMRGDSALGCAVDDGGREWEGWEEAERGKEGAGDEKKPHPSDRRLLIEPRNFENLGLERDLLRLEMCIKPIKFIFYIFIPKFSLPS